VLGNQRGACCQQLVVRQPVLTTCAALVRYNVCVFRCLLMLVRCTLFAPQGIQEDCAVFLSWPWFGWALQVAVLGAVLAAWTTANIHSYKQSLWALAAVVIFTACHAGNKLFIMQPYSTGTLHQRQVRGLLGMVGVLGTLRSAAGHAVLAEVRCWLLPGNMHVLLGVQARRAHEPLSCASMSLPNFFLAKRFLAKLHLADCGAVGLHHPHRRRLPDDHFSRCRVSGRAFVPAGLLCCAA